jgi:hypothetical protein
MIGRSEDKAGGKPEDRPVGPPEDKATGKPEDRPVGPPEDKATGKPEDRPVGPPEDKAKGTEEDDEKAEDGPEACPRADAYPRAAALVESYAVPYETIITWICEGGYSVGDVALALKTSTESGLPADELLAQKRELGGWGQLWQELKLVGPKDTPGGPSKGKPGGRP